MMKGQLAGLMKQAQAMQDNLKKAQDELATIEVEGQSGAGLVKVTMTCKHDVKRIQIETGVDFEVIDHQFGDSSIDIHFVSLDGVVDEIVGTESRRAA